MIWRIDKGSGRDKIASNGKDFKVLCHTLICELLRLQFLFLVFHLLTSKDLHFGIFYNKILIHF